jgi:flagellar hook assembly protein FlgD
VLRRVLIAALVAGVAAAPAQAQLNRVLLMPGVTYERQVQFTSHGPVAIHVMTAPRPGGLWSVRSQPAKDVVQGRERLTTMQANLSAAATVAGINGDVFSVADGRPHGMVLTGGRLVAPPTAERSSIGFTADGSLRVERVQFFGTWHGTGQRRPLTLNGVPGPNGVALFTPAWGPTTPAVPGSLMAVVQPLPLGAPNVDVRGAVAVAGQNGPVGIPPDGAVLVARGSSVARLAEEAPVGGGVTVRLLLSPTWDGVSEGIGGGPLLVRDGRAVFRHGEVFPTTLLERGPRSAVAQLADGRLLLVAVDGKRRGYSVGMTNFDLAQVLVRLGAVTAAALDGGDSTAMAFDGKLLNRPSDPSGERAISNALLVSYAGVYAAPPSEAVLAPNGDGVADIQALSYKLPRPATVTVDLVGPGNVVRRLETGPKEPGAYSFTWSGTAPDGSAEREGRWRLSVSAVDDLGRTSSAERLFELNRTLGGLAVAPSVLRVRANGPALAARFRLTRPARVTGRVETRAGAVVAVVSNARLGAGAHTLTWRGRTAGGLAHSGSYVFRVSAVNELGRAEIAQPFTVRRVAG